MTWQESVMSLDEATSFEGRGIPDDDRTLVPYAKLKDQAKIAYKAGQQDRLWEVEAWLHLWNSDILEYPEWKAYWEEK